jgi:LAO/AO transport system kinase
VTGGEAPAQLLATARTGDRVALARLLSAVENDAPGARGVAAVTWTTSRAYAVGVTGAPGAGKSTLTDRLIGASLGRAGSDGQPAAVAQLGVLCVDPTSPRSGGAILGDRVRMQDHALDPRVFIRSLASRGHLGGLSVAVPDALAVLGAVGFELVFVETVGVGQVELEVAATADATVVVVTPGWGDALQAAKAGILEVADIFVVNKADRPGAAEARQDLDQMLNLGTGRDDGWRPPIVDTVATEDLGTSELLDAIDAFRAHERGERAAKRRLDRAGRLLQRLVAARLSRSIDDVVGSTAFGEAARQVACGDVDPYSAVDGLLAP